MKKLKLKRGDSAIVISGSNKGKSGSILEVNKKSMRILIEGVNLRKTYQKATQENPERKMIEREVSIAYSNVMSQERFNDRKIKNNTSN